VNPKPQQEHLQSRLGFHPTYRRTSSNLHTQALAVSSRSVASARRRIAESGLENVAAYDHLDRALAHPGVDLVSMCTPQHLHCAKVLATARAGTHLVIEKPVAVITP
jgi:predicted dehydrogenase